MSVTAAFLAVIAVGVMWWLSRQHLTAKPWLEVGAIDAAGESALPPAKIGLGVFLVVVGCLFALFFSAYFMRMDVATVNTEEWRPLPIPSLLWINTGLLVLSAGALQLARVISQREKIERVKAWLIAGGGLALAFLAGQLVLWRQLVAADFFLTTNPANAFFYLITGVHGIHVLGGLIALGRTSAKVWAGGDPAQARLSLELCVIYWHFLLFVWLVFFAILINA